MPATPPSLFPPILPNRHGMLAVDDVHTIYWEEVGNPNGIPVVFLHGGPGAGLSPQHRRFFDPNTYRVILFDQRGAGKSLPLGEWRNNTTQLLIDDIERLRTMFGIERWLVFGGSWGSTLALAYGQAHPQRCLGFVLRGIFLCTPAEIEFFLYGVQWFYPELYDEFVAPIPPEERGDLIDAYYKRLTGRDRQVQLRAAAAWSQWEGDTISIRGPEARPSKFNEIDFAIAFARIECHFFVNGGFFDEDGWILKNAHRLKGIPGWIAQGRFDVVTPLEGAWTLKKAWPDARLDIVWDAGHASTEPGIIDALVRATDAAAAL